MAVTQKYLGFNKGSRNEDYIEAKFVSATRGVITSRLRHIDSVMVCPKGTDGGAVDMNITVLPNITGTGQIFIASVASDAVGVRCVLRCVGR